MDQNHPALAAARSSWRFVQEKNKQAWLDLMADDVVFEDPIGVAPTNPDGHGVRGKAALSEFWDKTMAPATIRIEPHESFAAGQESAHVMTLRTSFANGVTMIVHGIFTYRLNDGGKLQSLRGYWSMEDSKVEREV